MAKFNTGSVKAAKTATTTSFIKTKDSGARLTNASGELGFKRGLKSELFLLAVSNFVGRDTYYESAQNRDDRFVKLCREVAVDDQVWFTGFVRWLRNDAYMRSASIVAAAEGAHAILSQRGSFASPRGLVAACMARADEPGEFLAYWNGKFGPNHIPASVKKGLADAVTRLYNEYSTLKYDTGNGIRFGQILQVTHPRAKNATQNDLFKYILDKNYGNSSEIPESLRMIVNHTDLMQMSVGVRKAFIGSTGGGRVPDILQNSGMTWESLAGWLQGPMDSAAWNAIIPNMGYMALLRNIRNFQDAGISAKVMKAVLDKLSDPEEVAKSKQFPFRFLSAYQVNKSNLKVASALEDALQASLANVPELSGRTLILVDRSGSMFPNYGWGYSKGLTGSSTETLSNADKAAIFGTALALRAENATLVQFGSSSQVIHFTKSDSLLPTLNKFTEMGGTNTESALRTHFNGHDRVVIVTDEQYNGGYRDPLSVVPAKVPVYTWNLMGYASAHGTSGSNNRHTFGGLTDKGFEMIPMIEAGVSQSWPWLNH